MSAREEMATSKRKEWSRITDAEGVKEGIQGERRKKARQGEGEKAPHSPPPPDEEDAV